MPSRLLQKCLADLRAARPLATTTAERVAIDGAIADIVEGILASGGMPEIIAPQVSEPALSAQPNERPMSKHSPFYGMGLKEACPKLLWLIGEKTGKVPQTPREIWEQLQAEGWTSNHHDPAHSVYDALRRRAKTHGDVLIVGSGKWGRTDWYSDAELEDIRKSVGGMGGRDRGEHIERTKAGMATAKLRGARLGAIKKLTAEQATQLIDMVRDGIAIKQIAKHFEISAGSIYNYLRAKGYTRRDLRQQGEKLRAGGVDPSTEPEPGETRH
jgi:hypothetical protein